MNRRKFIETSGATAGAAMPGSVTPAAKDISPASEARPGRGGKIKLGLYSITYGGIRYNGDALSFDEFCKQAKYLGAKYIRLFAAWTGVPIHEGDGTYNLVHDHGVFYTF
jgi:hypothetical protein